MKVSIIVPVYNVEKYLERCLTSIIEQNLKDYEIVAKLPKKLVEEKIRDVNIRFDETMLHVFDVETGTTIF